MIKKELLEVQKIEAVISNLADGLLMLDDEGKISLVNRRAEKFLKIKKAALLGKAIAKIGYLPELSFLPDFLSRQNGRIKKEIIFQGGLTLEISVSPVKKGGKNLGLLIILRDITREKMIEKMKTEFVSLAAHQLRTPLSAIKWSLRMLLDGESGSLNKQQKASLEITYESNERIICLINDLLDVTSIEEGKYLKNFIEADMKDIIQDALGVFKKEAAAKNIALNFHCQKSPKLNKKIKIAVDKEKIKLALENLLENAVRYSPEGSAVDVFLSKGNKKIRVDILDKGIGIPKHQQARVFDKFFRASNAVKIDTMGTGLGLFLAKNIIEAHGGRIWFESEENQGTRFHLTLPAKTRFA